MEENAELMNCWQVAMSNWQLIFVIEVDAETVVPKLRGKQEGRVQMWESHIAIEP
ncbi:MAG: hypothetical protein JST47_15030 [Bacteroidetes bacterium]|nr:hypothetical protein [Bacteroidota bacterium]MBS1973882.1 hypothetical protein [Bacteroidota bacterium]